MPSLALAAAPSPQSDAAKIIAAALAQPDTALDYAELKLTFDALVEPFDMGTARDELDRLTVAARALAEGAKDELGVLAAVRTCLHVAGPWNGHRSFGYDRGDPDGQDPRNARLGDYLARRLGNCVAMPALLLIVCDRLGLDVALACAPLHVFVRVTLRDGCTINLEATSGGHPARDAWYREQMPMSDRAVESGLYLRTLSRRESAALMAHDVVERLLATDRYEDVLATTDAVLRHNHRDGHLLMKRASAYAGLIEVEFDRVYPSPFLIPVLLRPRYHQLKGCYRSLVATAANLGWEPVQLEF